MNAFVRAELPAPGVLLLQLDRPAKHNALCAELLTQLGNQLAAACADESIRAVVLTGTDPAFCAGQAWARRIALTGETLDAATALRIGLLTELVEHDSLVPRAVELAAAIAQTDRGAATEIRRLFDIARDEGAVRAYEAERVMLARQVPGETSG